MEGIIEKILSFEITVLAVNHFNNLGSLEMKIYVTLVAVLILFLVYRWFGNSAFWGFLLIYALAFIIYQADVFNFYKKQTHDQDIRMEQIENEIN